MPGGGRVFEDDDGGGVFGLVVGVEVDAFDGAAADVLREGGEARAVREVLEDDFAAAGVWVGGGEQRGAVEAAERRCWRWRWHWGPGPGWRCRSLGGRSGQLLALRGGAV